jgi:FAD/FMN-containing dehydrogenase
MTGDTAAKLSALKSHLSNTPIKLYTPDSSPDYKEVESCWIARPIQTLAVARPRSAEDVSTLIRYCTANDVAFSVRGGGHDCAGRTRIQGALLIDMRDFDSVVVAEDKKTARVGGGVLLGKVQKTLAEQGLVTPGYVVPPRNDPIHKIPCV